MRALFRGSVFATACLALAVPLAVAGPDEKPKVKVEFRRAETKNADGLTPATIAGTDEKIYLHATADATNADIAEARVAVDGACNPAIEVTFTKDGAKKMEALSEKHQDKPLAILIDGKVVSAPVVRAKFSDKAQITGKFTKEEVEKIVKAINAK
jgi:preprotein translocase subunit SecD